MLGVVLQSSTKSTYTKEFQGNSKTYKRILLSPLACRSSDADRMWHFYGNVSNAKPFVPITQGYSNQAEGISAVALEFKTQNFEGKHSSIIL